MNETTDPNNQILIVAIIAFYLALLGSWSQLLPRSGDDKTKRDDAPTKQRTGSSENTSSADTPLDVIREIDPNFDLAAFLAGAKTAYEFILRAYADGDIQTLKRLVEPEVLDTFERAIAGRRVREETLQLTFIGTSEAKIVDAFEEDGTAEIAVRFVSDMVSATRSANDVIVAGDPQQIVEVIDTWTFACETPSTRRNWMLLATEGE
ncbi:Tim44/TimA family putative adaptor protein [Mesorhizobium delmotii]|uniref:Putative Import inner membrane translocase subunit Tim44 n=1 Tax=Mesorhizobium delmotii TaxID=1631247 RepID=A0A2P9AU05_9HYPH|nr:Tim44/TimA family putative adaptor protein [Mesorhizobium delmotii]SJM34645.1 putative Import inner membrane translocase subunit Tim44 [Mesorhizobium delmotii]